MSEKSKLEEVEFADNPEPRCPCVLLLDTSASMGGDPIKALNDGLRTFKQEASKDTRASLRVEVCVITFDSSVTVVRDFSTIDDFDPPTLVATGSTHMGTGITTALAKLEERKQAYKRNNNRPYFRPWLIMITDGQPQGESSDAFRQAAEEIQRAEAAKKVVFWSIAVQGADTEKLKEISRKNPPMKLEGLKFAELFGWLSDSLSIVSRSELPKGDDTPGVQVPLPNVCREV